MINEVRSLISHSEADAFAQCEKKHEYAHIQKLQPKTSSLALNRGTAGHAMLEKFFEGIKAGESAETAKMTALINNELLTGMDMQAVTEAMLLVKPWIEKIWPTLGWKIVAIEEEFRIPVNEEIVYPFKVDLIIQHRGEYKIVDHKFTYDKYDEGLLNLLPQVPRYAGALQKLGTPIVSGIYNIFKTRKLNDPMDKYVQQEINFNAKRVENSLKELVLTMKEIHSRKTLGIEGIRTANKMNCGHCGFAMLCAAELAGEDTTMMREVDFEPNAYGYSEE